MSNLALLNTLRQANGKPALKSWKESKAKLEEAIQKEAPKTVSVSDKTPAGRIDTDKPTNSKEATVKRLANELRKVKQPKEKPAKSVATTSGKSTAEILKEFGINPKVGRALLRRHGVERTEAAIVKFLKGRSK